MSFNIVHSSIRMVGHATCKMRLFFLEHGNSFATSDLCVLQLELNLDCQVTVHHLNH